MALQHDTIKKAGTFKEQIVGYEMDGEHYMRAMSSLDKETVLTHPVFEDTRAYAKRLGTASRLAVRIYRSLHSTWKIVEVRRKLTSIAFQHLNAGKDPDDITGELWQFLADCGYSADITYNIIADSDKEAIKRLRKALKAAKRIERRKARKGMQVAVIPVVEKPETKKKLRIANLLRQGFGGQGVSRKGARTLVENTNTTIETPLRLRSGEHFACGNTEKQKELRPRRPAYTNVSADRHKDAKRHKGKPNVPV